MDTETPLGGLLYQIELNIKMLLDRMATGQRGLRLDTKEQQQANQYQFAHFHLIQVEPIWAKAMLLGIPGLPRWDGERQTAPEVVYQLQELAACVRAAAAPASPATKATKPAITPETTERGLNRTEEAVVSIIKAQPKNHGITGKGIIKELKSKGIDIAESSLRKHILPKLVKKYGVVNHRAAGGYLIP